MENHDRELIKKILASNVQLQRLYKEHEALESKLTRYEKRGFLTPAEEMTLKSLKRKKLGGVDKMMQILAAHRASEDPGDEREAISA